MKVESSGDKTEIVDVDVAIYRTQISLGHLQRESKGSAEKNESRAAGTLRNMPYSECP